MANEHEASRGHAAPGQPLAAWVEHPGAFLVALLAEGLVEVLVAPQVDNLVEAQVEDHGEASLDGNRKEALGNQVPDALVEAERHGEPLEPLVVDLQDPSSCCHATAHAPLDGRGEASCGPSCGAASPPLLDSSC